MRRLAVLSLVTFAVAVGVGLGLGVLAGPAGPSVVTSIDTGQVAVGGSPPFFAPSPSSGPGRTPSATPVVSPTPSASPTRSATPSVSPTGSASPTVSASPIPGPLPSPSLVPAPLDGVLVTPEAAARHPIAVMIDDLSPARPQSGFSSASVVWQAPAEGGIPRYMLVFQEQIPKLVGPVRSARYYYLAWAAEMRAVFVHSGGSPQAVRALRTEGAGQLVYDADEMRLGRSFWRVKDRFSPHNLYTDGIRLRALSQHLGAQDVRPSAPWSFAPALSRSHRPRGGRIEFGYRDNHIRYDYDWQTNTYLRAVTGETRQIDASTGQRVAPTNVVVMLMTFAPLHDGTAKGRLEAQVVGQGTAWIATNGTTFEGTWRKASLTEPTQFFDRYGQPVVLTVGQTFINVLETGSTVSLVAGSPAPSAPLPGGLHLN